MLTIGWKEISYPPTLARHLPYHSPTSGQQVPGLSRKIVCYLAEFSGINWDPFTKNEAYPRPQRIGHMCDLGGPAGARVQQTDFLFARMLAKLMKHLPLSHKAVCLSCLLSYSQGLRPWAFSDVVNTQIPMLHCLFTMSVKLPALKLNQAFPSIRIL